MAGMVEGIVLKTSDYQETSKISQVFTKEYGLIGLYLQGANRNKSRTRNLAQPISRALFNITYRKGLSNCFAGEVIEPFQHIKMDYDKSVIASHLFELIIKSVEQHIPMLSVYEHLNIVLTKINEEQNYHKAMLYSLMFELKLLLPLGVKPEIEACVDCNTTKNIIHFDVYKGGYVCSRCNGAHQIIKAETLKFIYSLFYKEYDALDTLEKVDSDVLFELRTLVNQYYQHYLGITTNSGRFFHK